MTDFVITLITLAVRAPPSVPRHRLPLRSQAAAPQPEGDISMNELLTPEPTEPSAEEGSTLNSQLLRLRGAADSMHTALLVWENHIDHPGARTAIHSAARVLLDAASAMPTHYDDAQFAAITEALRGES